MKTYAKLWVFFVLLHLGCSKNTVETQEEIESIDADYTVLLNNGNQIDSQVLEADYFSVSLSSATSPFNPIVDAILDFSENDKQVFYKQTTDCAGEIVSYDFSGTNELHIDVFPEELDCTITVTAVAQHDSYFYVGYEKTTAASQKEYWLRKIDTSSSPNTFEDIDLEEQPTQILFSNNRLFVLTLDVGITNENSLSVLNSESLVSIHNTGLGYNVKGIIKKPDGDIIVSYEELHSVVNVVTLAIGYTSYEESTAPKFHDSYQYNFDDQGNMYYNRVEEATVIPAIYNLNTNLVTLYYFENFLREEQINVEYQIDETTAVAFDQENGLMLIGYKKTGLGDKGGMLRIKPAPDPEFIDNIDLDGIPFNIFVR